VNPPTHLDIRALRYFVAVADDLHFTRAAARVFVTQQVLSREIAHLERQLGTPLFVRTTRKVTLTLSGERLLGRARELIALHDRAIAEVQRTSRPVVVDLHSQGRRTGRRVLDRARQDAPELEFRGRHSSGFGEALAALAAGEIDVAFGRVGGLGRLPPGLEHRLIRLEPLGLLLPATHPLARGSTVALELIRGAELDAGVRNPKAPEWHDLATQFLAFTSARPTAPHVPAEGAEEQADHLVRQGLPILTGVDHVAVKGGVMRVLARPAALYPWSIAYRTDGHAAGTQALVDAAINLGREERWLERPRDAWLPDPESALIRQGRSPERHPADCASDRY